MKDTKAIGIIRVSETRGRDGVSPREQAGRISAECERRGWRLVETVEELDVSGGTPLDRRDGLRHAIEMIETGEANVIVVAYFDRLVRSLKVQAEVLERIEAAKGKVLALDLGEVSNGTTAEWLNATTHGMLAEYHRRITKEKSATAQADAVARGVWMSPNVPPGYVRGDDGRLEPDPVRASVMAEAFRLRDGGATMAQVRAYMAEHGIERTLGSVTRLLASKAYIGWVEFGKLRNEGAHDAIVDPELFRRVQRVRVPKGRLSKSERLLARLGVLHCGSCGARLVVSSQRQHGKPYWFYRCANPDCGHKVTVGAELVEGVVVDAVKSAIRDIEGRASAERGIREAEARLERTQTKLDAAIHNLAELGLGDEPAALEAVAALRRERDEAEEHLNQLGGRRASVVVRAVDWEQLTIDERRALVRAVILRATVTPGGRGAGRVAVELLGE